MGKRRPGLLRIYRRLLSRFGPQGWWPAETLFEVVVGALLTQNTSWTNAEKALRNLRSRRLLRPEALANSDLDELETLVRPAGFYRQKARRLKMTAGRLVNRHGASLERFLRRPTAVVREELLSMEGVGPETADSILLYAGGRRRFVVDAYTRRVFRRLGLLAKEDYESVQRFAEENLPRSPRVYGEMHALIVALAKGVCRPRPRCPGCPLKSLCPSRLPGRGDKP